MYIYIAQIYCDHKPSYMVAKSKQIKQTQTDMKRKNIYH